MENARFSVPKIFVTASWLVVTFAKKGDKLIDSLFVQNEITGKVSCNKEDQPTLSIYGIVLTYWYLILVQV
jgi:hypothetical protein